MARTPRSKKRKSGYRPNESSVLREAGRRVAAARRASGLTQEEAADRAGIDYKRYQRLESGTVNATIRTLLRIAEAFDTSVWTMLEGRTHGRR